MGCIKSEYYDVGIFNRLQRLYHGKFFDDFVDINRQLASTRLAIPIQSVNMSRFRTAGRESALTNIEYSASRLARIDTREVPRELPIHRAVSDEPISPEQSESLEATPVTSDNEAPSTADNSPDIGDLDLERMADLVYDIIEQRLKLEQETQGL